MYTTTFCEKLEVASIHGRKVYSGPPGSSVHGIFRARGLEWGDVAFSAYETAIPIRLFFRDRKSVV